MLSSIIIGGDTDLVRYLRQVCAEFADICIYKIINTTARRYEVAGVLNAYVPDVVFLDVTDIDTPGSLAADCLQELLPQHPQSAVVPFSMNAASADSHGDPATLTPPFNAEQLERAVRFAMRRGRTAAKSSKVMAFLSAKPGAGATTLAVHFAHAAASEHQKKTLLIEADLHSGSVAYMLNLESTTFVGDAIQNRILTDDQWNRIVSKSHGMDILPACGAPHTVRSSRWDFYRLLKIARERYEVVVVDLPAVIDDVAESIIAEADKVTMVSTPELPSLSMVRRRLWELEARGVRHRHLQLLVNRYSPSDPQPAEMAGIAKREVAMVLPEDASALKTAGRVHSLASAKTKFGRGMLELTGELLGLGPPTASTFSLLKKVMSNAWSNVTPGAIQPPAETRLEAKSDYYHSGGGRQLDRW